jgi:anti-sigma factor RsiW
MVHAAPITDEELVAYLDDALDLARRREIQAALEHDEVLAARLGRLDIETDAIRAAFGQIEAAAPRERLRTRLQRGLEQDLSTSVMRSQWLKIAAVLLLGLGLGLGFGFGLGFGLGSGFDIARMLDGSKSWRSAVADYQALYTTATLASISGDSAGRDVPAVAAKLHLPITPDALKLAGLDFKRAQLLQFQGRPLAQFAYLDPDGTPIAFCATQTGTADSAITTGIFNGLAAASWNRNGFGFIVIGGTQADVVRRAAEELSGRI